MRLDNYLALNGYFDSRTKAKQAIERGEIFLDGKLVQKSSFEISDDFDGKIEYIFENEFVSLGGYKLNKALKDFNFNVENLVCADFGASTGGFTDCLLQSRTAKVYAIDLNDDLLHEKLKKDSRVVSIIKNVKDLTKNDFHDEIDLVVCDLSFISATLILPVMSNIINDNKHIILLIKPQFENKERKKFKNGIVKDSKTRKVACETIFNCAIANGLIPTKFTNAPINNGKNVEYLALLKKSKTEIPFDLSGYKF